jgi:hypothetical protein
MKNHRRRIAIIVLIVFAAAPLAPLRAATEIRHGADAAFRTEALGICWGIVKTPPTDSLQVVIRIRVLDPAKNPFRSFAVKAVHPFSGAAEAITARRPLEAVNDVFSEREAFKDMGGRQILFFRQAAGPADQPPDLMVDYLGIPDTAPQFADKEALEGYFAMAFDRLMKP